MQVNLGLVASVDIDDSVGHMEQTMAALFVELLIVRLHFSESNMHIQKEKNQEISNFESEEARQVTINATFRRNERGTEYYLFLYAPCSSDQIWRPSTRYITTTTNTTEWVNTSVRMQACV